MKRKISMIVAFSVLGVILLSVLVYYFGAFYPKFNNFDKKKEFEIPGLDEAFVPQGMDYLESESIILISGYMSDKSPSRIYVIDRNTGETQKFVTVKNLSNEDYFGHAGGIATNGNKLWIVGDKTLLTAKLSDILSAQNGESVKTESEIETGNGCDFVDTYGDKLIVGEFYKESNYETPENHRIKVNDNEITNAVAYIYKINNSSKSGVEDSPIMALTLPDKAQGIAITGEGENEKITISTSWSIGDSNLITYSSPFNKSTQKTIRINNQDVNLYELNSTNLESSIKAPSMSEEMTVVDGRVFILFESACEKYRAVNRTRTKYVLSIKF